MKKKIFISIMAAILTLGQAGVMAEQTAEITPVIAARPETTETKAFVQKSGTIKSVEADMYIAEYDGGQEFWVEKTALITDEKGEKAELSAGDKFTLFVNANAPMLLSYPERYSPELIVVQKGEEASLPDVDMYYKSGEDDFGDYINSVKKLALNVSEETKIVDKDGNDYKGSLDSKELAVFYSITTMSIPPQTPPDKIIVLNSDIDSALVKGERVIFKPCKADAELLPLRAICETLGFDVTWDGELQSIRVGNAYTLQIGKNSYVKGKAMPITLKSAPVLEDGVTYVPAEYFSEVLEATVDTSGDSVIITDVDAAAADIEKE